MNDILSLISYAKQSMIAVSADVIANIAKQSLIVTMLKKGIAASV